MGVAFKSIKTTLDITLFFANYTVMMLTRSSFVTNRRLFEYFPL